MHENLPTIPRLFELYVKGSAKEAIVPERSGLVCHLTKATQEAINSSAMKVYISSRVIKHIYDKRPAEEFDMVIALGHSALACIVLSVLILSYKLIVNHDLMIHAFMRILDREVWIVP